MTFTVEAMATRATSRQAFVVHDFNLGGGMHSAEPGEQQEQGHCMADHGSHARARAG